MQSNAPALVVLMPVFTLANALYVKDSTSEIHSVPVM